MAISLASGCGFITPPSDDDLPCALLRLLSAVSFGIST
jgi:hypothetical protein